MSDRTRLLFIIDSYRNPYAGTEGQLLKLLEGLDRERFDPVLAVFRPSDFLANNPFPVPVQVLGIGRMVAPGSWVRLFRYFRRMRRAGFRVAHIFFNDASIICPPILKLLGYRVIISRRDMGYWYTRGKLLPLRLNARIVDRVIVNSRAVRDVTCRREGYPERKVSVIYNGYPDVAQPVTAPVAGGDAEGLRLVLVANIRPIKRIQDAIGAVSRVVAAGQACSLTIVGDGEYGELEALSERLGVRRNVHFAGPSDAVAGLLPRHDVGLLCSESEGFSNTLIEYLQAGLPVICSAVGGNPEIIEHGVNGLLYPAGDVDALGAHILTLAGDPDLRRAMGRAGRARIKSDYGLSKLVAAHQDIYEALVAGR